MNFVHAAVDASALALFALLPVLLDLASHPVEVPKVVFVVCVGALLRITGILVFANARQYADAF